MQRFNDQPSRPTMSVEIDGEIQIRQVDQYDAGKRQMLPVLRDGEELFWTIGSDIPTIVQTGS